MTIKEIKQMITNLPPEELARFRAWFNQFESEIKFKESNVPRPTREMTHKLRGSLKGSGAMKAFMEERRRYQ